MAGKGPGGWGEPGRLEAGGGRPGGGKGKRDGARASGLGGLGYLAGSGCLGGRRVHERPGRSTSTSTSTSTRKAAVLGGSRRTSLEGPAPVPLHSAALGISLVPYCWSRARPVVSAHSPLAV